MKLASTAIQEVFRIPLTVQLEFVCNAKLDTTLIVRAGVILALICVIHVLL
jgi:hypothetical protein